MAENGHNVKDYKSFIPCPVLKVNISFQRVSLENNVASRVTLNTTLLVIEFLAKFIGKIGKISNQKKEYSLSKFL